MRYKMVAGFHSQRGLASSHFFFLLRHVMHPVLVRPLATLAVLTMVLSGYLRGLPLGLLNFTGASGAAASVLAV